MKEIKRFEDFINGKINAQELAGENNKIFIAYKQARQVGCDTLNFDNILEENDINEIINFCKKEDIENILISDTSTGLMNTLASFTKQGCEIAPSVKSQKTKIGGFLKEEIEYAPAITIKIK